MRKTDTEKCRPSRGEQQDGNDIKLNTILLIIIFLRLDILSIEATFHFTAQSTSP